MTQQNMQITTQVTLNILKTDMKYIARCLVGIKLNR